MAAIARVWIAGIVAFMALDGLWLGVVMKKVYAEGLHGVARLKTDGSIDFNWAAALPVYLLLIGGLFWFVLPRAADASPLSAAKWGALMGLVVYGVYDLTNLATLRDYPVSLAVVDMAWGAFASAVVAAVMRWAGSDLAF